MVNVQGLHTTGAPPPCETLAVAFAEPADTPATRPGAPLPMAPIDKIPELDVPHALTTVPLASAVGEQTSGEGPEP